MNAAKPMKDEGAGARDTSPLKQNLQHFHCAGTGRGVKPFVTLQAPLALAGFSVTQSPEGDYVIARWNQTRKLEAVEQVELSLRAVAP